MQRAWCLALVHSLGYVCGFEDVAALIQQQQFVAALEAEAPVHQRAGALPDPGIRGYRVSRLNASAEAGGSVVVNFSNFCEQHDDFGPRECTVYYGMPVRKTVKIHLASGLQSGDIIHSSWDLRLNHNTSSMWSFLVPKSFYLTSSCPLCENRCHYAFANAKYVVDVSTPTTLDSAGMCENDTLPPQQDFVLEDKLAHPFPVPQDVALDGNLTFGFGIFGKDGNTRAYGSYIYRMTPGLGSAATALVAESKPKVTAKGSAGKRVFQPMELLTEVLLPQMLLEPSAELAKEVGLPKIVRGDASTSLSSVGSGKQVTHALGLNVTVKKIPRGSSISLVAENGCSTVDGNGSISCVFPATGTINFSTAVNMSFMAEPGSTMHIYSQQSHAGGLLGSKTKRKEVHAPLCSSFPITVTDLKGKSRTYQPGRCGQHSFSIASLAPHLQQLADFEDFLLPRAVWLFNPLAPKTFDELLPISQVMELELKHRNNHTFVHLEMAVSLLRI